MTERGHAIDLLAERVGGCALATSDDFFASMHNLVKPGRGVFIEDKYTDRGKWMDGWESRRRRGAGHDWCVLRLGLPGRIRAVCVDTNHFRGNHPDSCSLEACALPANASADHFADATWTEILAESPLQGHTENVFDVSCVEAFTHVRLHIYPDGGVARLRVYGDVCPEWWRLAETDAPIDLVAIEHGGRVVSCSDEFFGEPLNLLMPGSGVNMGDGWETRRRRGPGHDWVILELGHRGRITKAEIDTHHFKGNFPESCSLEGADGFNSKDPSGSAWSEILPRTPLEADKGHLFVSELRTQGPFTHVRFNIYPDGGVSRLRLYGTLDVEPDA